MIQQPGRALAERGVLQAYYFDKQRLIDLVRRSAIMSDETVNSAIGSQATQSTLPVHVHDLAIRCLRENEGKFSEAWLRSIGLSQREARRTQADWARHIWIEQDLALSRAWVIAPCIRAAVENGSGDAPTHGCTDRHEAHEPRTDPHEPSARMHGPRTEGD